MNNSNPTNNLPPGFLKGQIMINVTLLQGWQYVVNTFIGNTSGALYDQFLSCQTQINALLAATPPSNLSTIKIVIPISLVNTLKYALATYDYQMYPPNSIPYMDCQESVSSVYDCYSIAYYTGPINQVFIY
jgi:hypothetical protein